MTSTCIGNVSAGNTTGKGNVPAPPEAVSGGSPWSGYGSMNLLNLTVRPLVMSVFAPSALMVYRVPGAEPSRPGLNFVLPNCRDSPGTMGVNVFPGHRAMIPGICPGPNAPGNHAESGLIARPSLFVGS